MPAAALAAPTAVSAVISVAYIYSAVSLKKNTHIHVQTPHTDTSQTQDTDTADRHRTETPHTAETIPHAETTRRDRI